MVDGLHGMALIDSLGCYALRLPESTRAGDRRVQVHAHGYETVDTLVAVPATGAATLHIAMVRLAPACCRLAGEWTATLRLDSVGAGNRSTPRDSVVSGRFVFSTRLPTNGRGAEPDDVEGGRFDVDLSAFFGGLYARDVSTTFFGPIVEDYFQHAEGEVFAGDSVHVTTIPGMSHGGLMLFGRVQRDTIRGRWEQKAYCCGASGTFQMHRVPSSPAGDSLVERAVRAHDEGVRAAEQAQAARARRIGHFRLRVWDEGAGTYVEVRFAAEGHDDNPGGGTTILAYSSGENGWGEYEPLEPGRWDLLVYEFTCDGEERMADDEFVRRALPRITLTIEPGARVDKDIRLDVCAIKAYDLTDTPTPVTRRDVRSSR